MSTFTDDNQLLKRYILLDLFAAMDFPQDREFMLDTVLVRAKRLTDRAVNWRAHVVRSKRYKGTLGSLYDKVLSLQNKSIGGTLQSWQ